MNLDVDGTIIPNATADDIARAIKARPSSGNWSITLEDGEGRCIQAFAEAGMQFRLTCRDKQGQFDGKALVAALRLQNVLTSYLNDEKAWRNAIAWKRSRGNGDEFALIAAVLDDFKRLRAGKPSNVAPGELSPLTILGALAIVALFFAGVALLPKLQGVLSHLPWPFDTQVGQILLLVVLVPVGISLVVLQSKLRNIRLAAGWSTTTGRVITSEVRANRSGSTIKNPLFENLPYVSYEFEVAGRKFVGDRISFGDDTGGANTQATLARYPVGSPVTLYYDPKDPTETVLERTAPKGLKGGCLSIVAVALVGVAVIGAIATTVPGWIEAHLANARNPNLATLTGLMGLGALMMSFAYWRRASQAARWPAVPGVITFSGVQEQESRTGSGNSTVRTYQANIEYTYKINAQSYVGRQIKLGVTVAGTRAAAEAVIARYPLGASVEVHYNADDPGDTVLERSSALMLVPLALALGLIAFSLYLVGIY